MNRFRICFRMPYERGTPRWVKKSYMHISQAGTAEEAIAEALRKAPRGWYISKMHQMNISAGTCKSVNKSILDEANAEIVRARAEGRDNG